MSRSFIVGVLATLFCAILTSPAHESQALFPPVNGWTLAVRDTVYTSENLWDVIDGAADLFLSYGFVDLHIAEYRDTTGIDVRVELYRHSSLENTFGMYSQERNPEYGFIDVGTQGYIEDGVLNFLCGISYVKISSHRLGKEGRDAMTLVARKVEKHLKQEKRWPDVLAIFPPEGKQVNSESYIAENFMGYRFLHSAYVAEYEAARCRLFIIEAETQEQAREMTDSYLKAVHQSVVPVKEGTHLVNDPHNGKVRLLLAGRYLCGILNCGNEETSQRLIRNLQARLTKTFR